MCFLLLSSLTGCSLTSWVNSSQMAIDMKSEPIGAHVFYEGKDLGQTPLALSNKELNNMGDASYVLLSIKKNKYKPVELTASKVGINTYKVKLERYTEESFKSEFLKEFQQEANKLIRKVLEAQGLLMVKNYKTLRPRLAALIKEYPYIGSLHTMEGVIHFQNRNLRKARSSFLRAITLDENDSSAKVLLKKVEEVEKR